MNEAKHFCSICGAERDEPEQVDVSQLVSTFNTKVYGRYAKPCPTPRCGEVCKICRREPGDVHGPDCGPLMAAKLERPHIVDESDCRGGTT
ncbi:hypothetical protein ACQP1P_38715 [Dactylosporangium sp. CA-052675]|uniref:hypothetical protein n=1 Tax=Dactylosporangium sp. CA-052675 TaxID=3239927 RepID=UPI003D8F821D